MMNDVIAANRAVARVLAFVMALRRRGASAGKHHVPGGSTLSPDDLVSIGAEIILSNTYHLYLRPGVDAVRRMGGLQRFMGWDWAILTDSGGFQVMSLSALRKVNDRGVEFRSHLDGSRHLLAPEDAIRIQDGLGTDIAMSLDELIEMPAGAGAVRQAVDRTLDWAARGWAERERLRAEGGGAIAQGATAGAGAQGGGNVTLSPDESSLTATVNSPSRFSTGTRTSASWDRVSDWISTTSSTTADACGTCRGRRTASMSAVVRRLQLCRR